MSTTIYIGFQDRLLQYISFLTCSLLVVVNFPCLHSQDLRKCVLSRLWRRSCTALTGYLHTCRLCEPLMLYMLSLSGAVVSVQQPLLPAATAHTCGDESTSVRQQFHQGEHKSHLMNSAMATADSFSERFMSHELCSDMWCNVSV